jgi:flagellar biosynthesis/type III secretory pathway ATPase
LTRAFLLDEAMIPSLPDDQVQQIMAAVFAGRKIEAIKIYRQGTKASLSDAVQFINALEARLRQESPEKFTVPPASGCAKNTAALVALGISVYVLARYWLG